MRDFAISIRNDHTSKPTNDKTTKWIELKNRMEPSFGQFWKKQTHFCIDVKSTGTPVKIDRTKTFHKNTHRGISTYVT